jgi:hypothetical protein
MSMRAASRTFCFAGLALLATSIASAAVSLNAYRQAQKEGTSETQLKDYLYGVGMGYIYANAQLLALKQPRLFCQPDMALTVDNFTSLLNREIAQDKWKNESDIESILLVALMKTFPCK